MVIAVLAILVSLAVPVVKSTISRAQMVKCATNLKDLGAATQAYVADNNGFLPVTYSISYSTNPNGNASFEGGAGAPWAWLLAPYVGVPRWDTVKIRLGPQGGSIDRPCVFTCPSHGKDEPSPIVFPSVRPISYAPSNLVSYSMRGADLSKPPTTSDESADLWIMRLSDVVQPSRKVWLMDSAYWNISNVSSTRWTSLGSDGWARISFTRHDGAGNVVFFDGHVERITYASIISNNLNQNIRNLFDPSTEIK